MTLEMTAITFFIKDAEWEDEYEYTGYFFEEEEVNGFIADNEKVGNDLRILKVEILEGNEVLDFVRGWADLEEAVEEFLKKA